MSTTSTKPTVRIEQITPTIADKYLGTMQQNRVIRDDRVARWVLTIERDEWRLLGDSLCFDEHGHLLNGQHRLTALVISGQTLPFCVLRGIPAETQGMMDSGLARKTSDALSMRGETDAFAKAAALRWLHRLSYIEASEGKSVHYSRPWENPSTAQLLQLWDERGEDITWAMSWSRRAHRELRVTAGSTNAVMVRQRELDEDETVNFWERVLSGAELKATDPLLLLHKVLLSPAGPHGHRSMEKRVDYREVALISKAWNYWRDGAEVGQLMWKFGGSTRERFPLMH